MIKHCSILILVTVFFPAWLYAQYNVRDFGANGDGNTIDTKHIQDAIDKAYNNHGGTVEFPAGTYKVGSLFLKDNIRLHLHPGAVIQGSPDVNDYTAVEQKMESRTRNLYARYFMIFAEGAQNISITGAGIIDGNGRNNFQVVRPQNDRPVMMRLVDCKNVYLQGVQFLEAANWTIHLLACKDVNIEGITIENNGKGNRDGLDIDGCERVLVSGSKFSTTDDAIVLKATSDSICSDIAVNNCIMRTTGSAFKIGTESNGGFKNISVGNCIFKDVPNHAGIELLTVDGGIMQNISLQNIVMENVGTPFFIRLGNRARPYKAGQYVKSIGDVSDIILNNISVTGARYPSAIMGLNSQKIRNISVTNYSVRYAARQKGSAYNAVPFKESVYPMAAAFRNLPAYGIYASNVEGLHLQNITAYSHEDESRAAFAFDKIDNLALAYLKAEVKNADMPLAHFRHINHLSATGCQSLNANKILFEMEETVYGRAIVSGNILQPAQKEIKKTAALTDSLVFEDLPSAIKINAGNGAAFKKLQAHDLKEKPFNTVVNIERSGIVEVRLLMLKTSARPQKVRIKYEGLTQEFVVNWNNWGWAPITLTKTFRKNDRFSMEITGVRPDSELKISKVYIIYPDFEFTD